VTAKLARQGYTRQQDGTWRKRVEFKIPRKPGVFLVKYLCRNAKGELFNGGPGKWMREIIPPTVDKV